MNTLSKWSDTSFTYLLKNNTVFYIVCVCALALSVLYKEASGVLVFVVALIVLLDHQGIVELLKIHLKGAIKLWATSAILATVLFLFFLFVARPFVELYFNKIDLSFLLFVQGSSWFHTPINLLFGILIAMGEELFYRVYIMKKFSLILGNKDESWYLATIISSLIFGLAYVHQGISGLLISMVLGLFFGSLYMKTKNPLLPIVVHSLLNLLVIAYVIYTQ